MPDAMDDAALAEFAAAQVRDAGLVAHVWDQSGQTFVGIEQQHTAYRRALVWVVTGDDREMTARWVRAFADLCERESVADGTILATCPLGEAARQTAREAGVGLLDREGVRRFVDDPAVGVLLNESGDPAGGSAGGRIAADRPESPPGVEGDRGESGPEDAQVRVSPNADLSGSDGDDGLVDRALDVVAEYDNTGAVVLAAVIVVFLAAVVAVAVFGLLPAVGSDDPAGMTFAAESTGDGGDLRVAWDARRTSQVDVSEDDALAYPAPDGSAFVVVELRLANVGDRAVTVRQSDFVLATNGTLHGYQPLDGRETFVEGTLSPGTAVTGTTVFRVPENATAARLVVDPGLAGNRSVAFERDGNLTVPLEA